MENEKRNRLIIEIIIVLLFLIVGIFVIYSVVHSKEDIAGELNLKINQKYMSDLDIKPIDRNYYIGTYEDGVISVIINNEGREVYKGLGDIYYDGVFAMKDGRYLIYSNIDNKLRTFIFDGVDIKLFYEIEDVSYVKPIIYKNIDREYIIGFASMVENDLYLYNLNSSGITVIKDTILVADNIDNGIYYTYNENYLVVKNNEIYSGVVDLQGNVIVEYKYKDIINTYYDTFIAVNKKDKYGIIDKNNNTLVKFKYKAIDFYKDYFVMVNTNNKMAIYDLKYKKVTEFNMNYDSLKEYDLRSEFNSINLYKVDGKLVLINNYLEDKNGIEYDKHNLYIIDKGKIVKTIKQIGFGNKDVVYTYDSKYNVSIYNNQFQLLYKKKLKNIDKIENISYVNNNTIRIDYVTKEELKTTYYDFKGNEIEFKLGDLFIKEVDYLGYLKDYNEQKKLTLYDYDGNKLDEIVGNNITYLNGYLIVDNGIYNIEIKK